MTNQQQQGLKRPRGSSCSSIVPLEASNPKWKRRMRRRFSKVNEFDHRQQQHGHYQNDPHTLLDEDHHEHHHTMIMIPASHSNHSLINLFKEHSISDDRRPEEEKPQYQQQQQHQQQYQNQNQNQNQHFFSSSPLQSMMMCDDDYDEITIEKYERELSRTSTSATCICSQPLSHSCPCPYTPPTRTNSPPRLPLPPCIPEHEEWPISSESESESVSSGSVEQFAECGEEYDCEPLYNEHNEPHSSFVGGGHYQSMKIYSAVFFDDAKVIM